MLYLGGEGAECLVMPVNPADPLEAVTFEKHSDPDSVRTGTRKGGGNPASPNMFFQRRSGFDRACGPADLFDLSPFVHQHLKGLQREGDFLINVYGTAGEAVQRPLSS